MLRDEVGLSKGGLYHHVKSKNDILLMVCDAAGGAMLESLHAAQTLEGSGLERLKTLLGSHLDLVLEYGGGMWAFFAERRHLSDEERDRVLAWERKMVHGVRRMISDVIEAGELRQMDTLVVSHTFLGMINWVTRWYRGNPPVAEVKQTLTELFFNGVLGADASPITSEDGADPPRLKAGRAVRGPGM